MVPELEEPLELGETNIISINGSSNGIGLSLACVTGGRWKGLEWPLRFCLS